MLAMVIRVMIGCVSTNHKSDCEIWPNSFLAAPVSRGEKCLMRSFPPVFFFFFSSFPFFLFPPSSLFSSLSLELCRVQKNLESVSIEFELGNLEANRDVRRSWRSEDTSATIPWTRKRRKWRKWRDTLRKANAVRGGKVTSG